MNPQNDDPAGERLELRLRVGPRTHAALKERADEAGVPMTAMARVLLAQALGVGRPVDDEGTGTASVPEETAASSRPTPFIDEALEAAGRARAAQEAVNELGAGPPELRVAEVGNIGADRMTDDQRAEALEREAEHQRNVGDLVNAERNSDAGQPPSHRHRFVHEVGDPEWIKGEKYDYLSCNGCAEITPKRRKIR